MCKCKWRGGRETPSSASCKCKSPISVMRKREEKVSKRESRRDKWQEWERRYAMLKGYTEYIHIYMYIYVDIYPCIEICNIWSWSWSWRERKVKSRTYLFNSIRAMDPSGLWTPEVMTPPVTSSAGLATVVSTPITSELGKKNLATWPRAKYMGCL